MKLSVAFLLLIFAHHCYGQDQNTEIETTSAFRANRWIGAANFGVEGFQFKVDDVELADTLLETYPAQDAFEYKLTRKIKYIPEALTDSKFVPCGNNGLIATVQAAYNDHRPLVLSPDAIWLTITQGVSIHINEHFDAYKDVIFTEKKPDEIVIRNDYLEEGGENWADLVASFSEVTTKFVKDDYYSFFVPSFSTTNDFERTAFEVTMLEGFSKAFKYIGETGCGIPTITLTGDKEDWQGIYDRLALLEKIGLGDWAESLRPVIREFLNALDNKIDLDFWQDIYKDYSEYGGFYLSGWIVKLFPYIVTITESYEDPETGNYVSVEGYKPNEFLQKDDYLMSTLSSDDFPEGISKINVTWVNSFTNTTSMVTIHSGIFAIKQYEDKSLEPQISWVLCEENPEETLTDVYEYYPMDPTLEHTPSYWYPFVVDSLTDLAVYDIKKFKTAENGNAFVKKWILKKATRSDRRLLKGKIVEIIVMLNGNVRRVELPDVENEALRTRIERVVLELPEKWFPALAESQYLVYDAPLEFDSVKVRAHSRVRIAFE